MGREADGYWVVTVDAVDPGTLYLYRLGDGPDRPDPASAFQPQGVHGPSAVVDHSSFRWSDSDWKGVPLEQMVIYELHVGTFTPAGTFQAIIPRLAELADLGITAIELMPIAQFAGTRNWGYDGVYTYAPQNSYGGPDGLRQLVNAAHRNGIAVILDAVYNHIGTEGNHFADFGPYFNHKYAIMWGKALNFDDAGSDQVRNFFIENALYWFRDYHIDALRLDAADAIMDTSARPILQELARATDTFAGAAGRSIHLIAETDHNDPRLIRPERSGGMGIHAQWCDDFHHAVHALLTDERRGYYVDFGRIQDLVDGLQHAYVYRGRYSTYRDRRHGSPADDRTANQFVVFSQNHDQVGNRLRGDRILTIVGFEAAKLAAAMVLLSPYVPLLFMGEEYAEAAPFHFFVDHSREDLIRAARKGRKQTMDHLGWTGIPPDPASPETFDASVPAWDSRTQGKHRVMRKFYRALLHLRRTKQALARLNRKSLEATGSEQDRTLTFHRWDGANHVICAANFGKRDIEGPAEFPDGEWTTLIDSADKKWLGPGSLLPSAVNSGDRLSLRPQSVAVFEKV
jgi:maltooligosyltrehalose trehalohydrolase